MQSVQILQFELAVIPDLFSHCIVGWAMETELVRSVILSTLVIAIVGRHPEKEMPCHSVQGIQHASEDYRKRLEQAWIVCVLGKTVHEIIGR